MASALPAVYLMTTAGGSCTEACGAINLSCSADGTKSINDALAYQSLVQAIIPGTAEKAKGGGVLRDGCMCWWLTSTNTRLTCCILLT